MVHQFRILCVLLGFSACLIGQQIKLVSVNWDSPKFRELDRSHILSKTKKLDEYSKSALIRAIAARFRPEMINLDIADEKELRAVAAESRFELMDLNGDGTPEVIVQPTGLKSGCGGTGNCPLWVFARSHKAYRLLAEIEGVQMYRRERRGNQGYFDIAVATHDSASEKHIYVYRYTHGTYRAAACYDAWWTEAKPGNWKRLSVPTITSCPLGEFR